MHDASLLLGFTQTYLDSGVTVCATLCGLDAAPKAVFRGVLPDKPEVGGSIRHRPLGNPPERRVSPSREVRLVFGGIQLESTLESEVASASAESVRRETFGEPSAEDECSTRTDLAEIGSVESALTPVQRGRTLAPAPMTWRGSLRYPRLHQTPQTQAMA